jgi:PAS domain S-box-containing protein
MAQASPDGRFLRLNQQLCDILGYTREELLTRSFQDITHPDDLENDVASLRRLLANEIQTHSREKRYIRKDRSSVWVNLTVSLRREPTGAPTYFVSVIEDITERKQAESEREAALKEARRAEKELLDKNLELNRFTSAVMHDLRGPLVTIQAFQGHLERDLMSQDAARVEEDLGFIRNAADKIGRLLDDLRRFTRIGRIMNPSEETPLQEIVQEALDLLAGRIRAGGVRVDLTEAPIVLYGDRMRLVEVFLNLVDNAIKFMGDEPAPRVEIGAEQTDEGIVLYVRDNGIGIESELQPLVFDLFRKLRLDSEGEGLGLALARRIVELHGGRIWMTSDGPGKGSTFRFTLAKTRRRPAEEEKL